MYEYAWSEMVQIRDAVHGYILIPKPIVKKIIDCSEFQRLKNIQQTGMGVLYPSATHDRFTHSLGVYHLGCRAYRAFRDNLKNVTSLTARTTSANPVSYFELIGEQQWIRWELLFQLACLLHDCGHAPFSHTLEFVYDLDLDRGKRSFSTQGLTAFFAKKNTGNYSSRFLRDLRTPNGFKGAPHERMSALYLTKAPFYNAIKELLKSWYCHHNLDSLLSKFDEIIFDDLEFMCRMITGCKYQYAKWKTYVWNCANAFAFMEKPPVPSCTVIEKKEQQWKLELQIRNCIIQMLNSPLDVDNLDYTVRDAHISGYESQQIDLERLLSAFTVINGLEFQNEEVSFTQLDGPAFIRKFEGNIDAYIFGACEMESLDPLSSQLIRVEGKLDLVGESFPDKCLVKERRYFFTEPGFQANVVGSKIRLKPPASYNETALFLRGYKCDEENKSVFGGTLDGVLYGVRTKAENGGQERIEFAFKKSCLSVLQSAVDARNYEYRWIYAHHTASYQNDFLLIYLLDRYVGYLLRHGVIPGYNGVMESLSIFSKQLPHDSSQLERQNSQLLEIAMVYLFALSEKGEEGELYYKYLFSGRDLRDVPRYLQKVKCCLDSAVYLAHDAISPCARSVITTLVKALLVCFQTCVLSSSRWGPKDIPKDLEVKLIKLTEKILDVLEHLPVDLSSSDELKKWEKAIRKNSSRIKYRDMALIQDLLAFDNPQKINHHIFYRSTDMDLLSSYKTLYQHFSVQENQGRLEKGNREFYEVLEEYFSRNYPHCAWKTFAEFQYYFREWTQEEITCLRNILRTFSIPNVNSWNSTVQGDSRTDICVMRENRPDSTNELINKIWDLLHEFSIYRGIWINKTVLEKSLPLDTTFIKMNDSVLRLKDVSLFDKASMKKAFFFLFYKRDHSLQLTTGEVNNLVHQLHSLVKNEITNSEAMK